MSTGRHDELSFDDFDETTSPRPEEVSICWSKRRSSAENRRRQANHDLSSRIIRDLFDRTS